jgi:hypothetical protein
MKSRLMTMARMSDEVETSVTLTCYSYIIVQ